MNEKHCKRARLGQYPVPGFLRLRREAFTQFIRTQGGELAPFGRQPRADDGHLFCPRGRRRHARLCNRTKTRAEVVGVDDDGRHREPERGQDYQQ